MGTEASAALGLIEFLFATQNASNQIEDDIGKQPRANFQQGPSDSGFEVL
jgi:hypothetical protein